MERAAPPLASASSFVRAIESIPSFSEKFCAELTASCPVKESATKITSEGFNISFILFNSFINSSSIWSLPAVSAIT